MSDYSFDDVKMPPTFDQAAADILWASLKAIEMHVARARENRDDTALDRLIELWSALHAEGEECKDVLVKVAAKYTADILVDGSMDDAAKMLKTIASSMAGKTW